MNYRKHGLRALGLSILAALGLMAFTAVGAQAQGEWLHEGVTFKDAGITSETISGTQEGVGRLLVLKLNLLLKCSTTKVENASITPLGHGSGQISFSGCEATDLKLAKAACSFIEPIVANVLAAVILHDDDPYILFSGSPFATVNHKGGLCPLPNKAPVSGSVVAAITTNNVPQILISTLATLSLFTDVLSYGTNEAHLEADAVVELSGINAGDPWGAH